MNQLVWTLLPLANGSSEADSSSYRVPADLEELLRILVK
jgi:hypothetical protein